MPFHPEAERLAQGFISDFWAANHQIKWLGVEQERLVWLSPNTALVGKRDSLGLTADNEPFFGDWKSASINKKRFIKAEKFRWKMSPQALTYGVLNGFPSESSDEPVARHFTVRWVFKTDPVTTDFEWYSYSESELVWWKAEILRVANQIRHLRQTIGVDQQWPINFHYCTHYGLNYPCKFRDGCWAQDFNKVPEGMTIRSKSHLDIENELKAINSDPELVVLDASRLGDNMGCNEMYRRLWEGPDRLEEDSEALTIGTDFHELCGAHLNQIKRSQQPKVGVDNGRDKESDCTRTIHCD